MRFSTKILILTSMPLAFQLCMALFLFEGLRDADTKNENELERKRIVATLDEIQHVHVRCLAAAAFYSISKDEAVGKRHIEGLKELSNELKQLRRQTESNPTLLPLTEELRKAIVAVVPYEMMMRKFSLLEDAPRLGDSTRARQLIKESIQLIQAYQSRLMPPADDIEHFKTSSTELQAKLALAFALVIAITLLLLHWSQQHVVNVISILLLQIEQFKSGKATSAQLKGNDEISRLEQVLCESTNRLIALENFRRELCSVVSHDIRAPMTSVGGLVTLLEERVLGPLNNQQEKLVLRLRTTCSNLSVVLNNILDLDKLRSDKWDITIAPYKGSELASEIERQLQTLENFSSVSVSVADEKTLSCDKEALGRSIVTLIEALGIQNQFADRVAFDEPSDATKDHVQDHPKLESEYPTTRSQIAKLDSPILKPKILVELAGEGCKVAIDANDDVGTIGPKASQLDHRIATAISLSTLFCEKQNLALRYESSDDCQMFWIAPKQMPKQASLLGSDNQSGHQPISVKCLESTSTTSQGPRYSKVGKTLLSLISVPMLVSATAILLLGSLVSQVSHDVRKQLIAREIVHRCTDLSSNMTHLMLLSIRRSPGELPEALAARERVKKQLDDDLFALKDLERQSRLALPDEVSLVERKVEAVKRFSDEVTNQPISALGTTMKKAFKDGELSAIAFSKAGSLLADREELDSEHASNMARIRSKVLFVLVGGSFITAVLTLIGAIHLSNVFVSHLKNVEKNASKLACGQALQTPTPGDNEIAYLDKFFFDTAYETAVLEKERKELSGLLRQQLKEPLASLKNGFEVLYVNADNLTDKGKQMIQRTLIEINRLNDLADDLLILDTLQDGGKLKLDIAKHQVAPMELVNRSIDAVSTMAKLKKIELRVVGGSSALVMADSGRSIQILVNLLSNAIKFSAEDGCVDVLIDEEKDSVRIEVKDNGVGIPNSALTKLFTRFDQIRPEDKAKGSGLGLFISKKLAEAQGGYLDVASVEGKGSSFWLVLPRA